MPGSGATSIHTAQDADGASDEAALTADIVELATRFGRYGNSKLRDELPNGEIFYSLAEARIIIEGWRRHYNTERPPSSLGCKPPAPEARTSSGAACCSC